MAFAENYAFTKGKNFWSLGATKMLKAEVYLWSGKQMGGGATDYNTAKTALQDVDKCAGLGLMDSYTDVFSFEKKKNKEIIFSIYYGENEAALLGGSWNSNFMPQQAYMNNGLRYTEKGEEVSKTKDAQINGLIRMPLKRNIYTELYKVRIESHKLRHIGIIRVSYGRRIVVTISPLSDSIDFCCDIFA